MSQRYHLTLPDPARARGADPTLAFQSGGADGLAAELQSALRTTRLFDAWRKLQDDPDNVDAALGATDPQATVTGAQRDLKIDLIVVTSVTGNVLKHRLRMLAGSGWTLNDVTSA
jgi:hypothetical protein